MSGLGELIGSGRPFALLHRPQGPTPGTVDLLLGDFDEVATTADIPLPECDTGPAGPPPGDGQPPCEGRDGGDGGDGGDRHDVLVLLPYRTIGERGYDHHDDGEPLLVMRVGEQHRIGVAEVLDEYLSRPVEVSPGAFDLDDEEYGDLVRRVLAEEIGSGAGANFVLRRTFVAELADWSTDTALAFWARLLRGEPGAYWTFLVHTGTRTFIGASPERHVSLDEGVAVMNPISGTYRYPRTGASVNGVLEFLADSKETNELYMVLDEELKMMSRLCDDVRVAGPGLKEMAHLAHTEYHILGRSGRDVREILHETLLAPTVTGSPVQSACQVIAKFEPGGRGYYSGVAALIGRDAAGARRMDSAIMIRTADVDAGGRMRIGVGATLVRDSDPAREAAETAAKAAGLLDALRRNGPPAAQTLPLGDDPRVSSALAARNSPLSRFWLTPATGGPPRSRGRLLIVDAEDTFTAMTALQLRSLGFEVSVRRFDEPHCFTGHDLVLLGPGPGDPREENHRKIAYLRAATGSMLNLGVRFVSVCLSHQVLASLLGLELRPLVRPDQGVRRVIDFFGTEEAVYFYNTFAAHSEADTLRLTLPGGRVAEVQVARDAATGEVAALRGPTFTSAQFHPESVMTRHGSAILDQLVTGALSAGAATLETAA